MHDKQLNIKQYYFKKTVLVVMTILEVTTLLIQGRLWVCSSITGGAYIDGEYEKTDDGYDRVNTLNIVCILIMLVYTVWRN